MAVLGSKNQSVINELLFTTTTTWACPFDCKAIVTVIGAGGAGGSTEHNNIACRLAAGGGGAGGVSKSLLTLKAGTSYTATVGAQGTYASSSGSDTVATGGTGGTSSFAGTGITTMSCVGGSGGVGYSGNGTGTGGAGGSGGSGGNIFNVTGGAGGTGTNPFYDGNGYHIASGGGGSAGIFGIAYRGGNANNHTSGYKKICCGGGAGVGGEGGDASLEGNGSTATQVSGLGGTMFGKGWSPAVNGTTGKWGGAGAQASREPNAYVYNFEFRGMHPQHSKADDGSNYYSGDANLRMHGMGNSIFDGLIGSSHVATTQNHWTVPGPGAGGYGYAWAQNYAVSWGMGGIFGGGAGCGNFTGSGAAYGAAGSFGAGGGGVAGYGTSNNYSGVGGQGLVVISILEYL